MRTWYGCTKENASFYSSQEMSTASLGTNRCTSWYWCLTTCCWRGCFESKIAAARKTKQDSPCWNKNGWNLLNWNLEVDICSEFAACASSLKKDEREWHHQQVPPSYYPTGEDKQRDVTAIRSKVFRQTGTFHLLAVLLSRANWMVITLNSVQKLQHHNQPYAFKVLLFWNVYMGFYINKILLVHFLLI